MEKWGSRELVPPMKVICEMGSIIHDSASRSRQSFSAALVHRRGGKSAAVFWPAISGSFPSLRCHRVFPLVTAWPRWVHLSPFVVSSVLFRFTAQGDLGLKNRVGADRRGAAGLDQVAHPAENGGFDPDGFLRAR